MNIDWVNDIIFDCMIVSLMMIIYNLVMFFYLFIVGIIFI